MDFTAITHRETFIPPPVLPAQAPISISVNKIDLENTGQASKFVVAYPVDVTIVTTWNAT